MNIEITPEENRLMLGLLVAHKVSITQSLEKFTSLDCNRLSIQLSEHVQKHISLIKHDIQIMDNLISMLKEVQA